MKAKREKITYGGNVNSHANESSGIQTGVSVSSFSGTPVPPVFEGYLRCRYCTEQEFRSEHELFEHLRAVHFKHKRLVATLIQNPQAYENHNRILARIKEKLERNDWIVAYLEESSGRYEPFSKPLPDLIALTPENVLVFFEYKKKAFDFFKDYPSEWFYKRLERYAEYMNWIDGTGIPMILVSAEGCWLVEP